MQNLFFIGAFLMALLILGCDAKPRVIESQPTSTDVNSIPAFKDALPDVAPAADEHKVVVKEALNTDKYTYLNVTENDKDFWIAISKRDVVIGETYYYTGGLLKKNFQSREFNRVFETIYLVSNIWQEPAASGKETALEEALGNNQGAVDLTVGKIDHAPGTIKLSDLFAQKEKYNGRLITVQGKCIKVNPMIMNRNWIHIQDGTGKDLELTITTTENIPLGAVIKMEGTIALDKDFGAGYRYDIIMEGATMK